MSHRLSAASRRNRHAQLAAVGTDASAREVLRIDLGRAVRQFALDIVEIELLPARRSFRPLRRVWIQVDAHCSARIQRRTRSCSSCSFRATSCSWPRFAVERACAPSSGISVGSGSCCSISENHTSSPIRRHRRDGAAPTNRRLLLPSSHRCRPPTRIDGVRGASFLRWALPAFLERAT